MIGAIAPTAVVTLKPVGAERFSVYGPLTAFGGYRVSGLRGQNNTGTPDTQFDMSADLVQLWNPSNHAITIRTATGTLTNNISTAGPAANGRDQAGAFSAESWLHFYFIWNGTTLATISSTTAPPTGPTLPTGYTHWAYAGAIRLNGSSALIRTRMRGARCWYVNVFLDGGLLDASPVTATQYDLSALVPPNAPRYTLLFRIYSIADAGATLFGALALSDVGTDLDQVVAFLLTQKVASTVEENFGDFAYDLPTNGQSVWAWGSSDNGLIAAIQGYQIPNGDA